MRPRNHLAGAVMAMLFGFASLASAQYFTIYYDTQNPEQNLTIGPYYSGNTFYLREYISDNGAALTVTSWTFTCRFKKNRDDTNGMYQVTGSATSSNRVLFVGTNVLPNLDATYYFSVVGTQSGTGKVKTFGTGNMTQRYDPAAGNPSVLNPGYTLNGSLFTSFIGSFAHWPNMTNRTFAWNQLTNAPAIPSTNGFVKASITNGLASQDYVVNATNDLDTSIRMSVSGLGEPKWEAVSNSVRVGAAAGAMALQPAATNGWIVTSHSAFLTRTETNGWVITSHAGFVTASITNGLLAKAATNGWIVTSHSGFLTAAMTNGWVTASHGGFVTASITNGLLPRSATNGWVITSHSGFVDASITNGLISASQYNNFSVSQLFSSASSPTAIHIASDGTESKHIRFWEAVGMSPIWSELFVDGAALWMKNSSGGASIQMLDTGDIGASVQAWDADLDLWATISTNALNSHDGTVGAHTAQIAALNTDVARLEENLAINSMRDLASHALAWMPYSDMIVDVFKDQTGVRVANTSNFTYTAAGTYYVTVPLSVVPPSSVDSNHLVLHYKLNDANKSGPGNITDSTTNALHGNGLLNVSPLDNPGHHGYCVTFDGATEDIIIPDNDKLSFGNGSSDSPFSISVWVRWPGSENMGVFFKGSSGAREYNLFLSSGAVYMDLQDDTSSYYNEWHGGTVPANTWTLVTFTYNGTPNNPASGQIYVNGVVQSTTFLNSGYTAMHNQSEDCGIMMGWHDSPNYTPGSLDDLRIYSDVLTSNEVYTLYIGDEENICNAGGTTGGDGVLTSTNFLADAVPTAVSLQVLVEPGETLNMTTDLVAQVSRNAGTNWTRVRLAQSVTFSNTIEVWTGSTNAFAGPAASNMMIRARSYNDKNYKLHGWSLLWK